MSALSLAVGRPTLADRFFERGLASDGFLILTATAATALLAQVALPLWPVPSTGQTLGVLLAGAALGAVRGAASMVLYLALAAAGLPVLAGGASGAQHLVGPTAGYLFAFVAAAALVGWVAQSSWSRSVLRSFVSFLAASILILIVGVAWLHLASGVDAADALIGGALVLAPGTVLKAVAATAVMALGWWAVERDDRRRAKDDLAVRN